MATHRATAGHAFTTNALIALTVASAAIVVADMRAPDRAHIASGHPEGVLRRLGDEVAAFGSALREATAFVPQHCEPVGGDQGWRCSPRRPEGPPSGEVGRLARVSR